MPQPPNIATCSCRGDGHQIDPATGARTICPACGGSGISFSNQARYNKFGAKPVEVTKLGDRTAHYIDQFTGQPCDKDGNLITETLQQLPPTCPPPIPNPWLKGGKWDTDKQSQLWNNNRELAMQYIGEANHAAQQEALEWRNKNKAVVTTQLDTSGLEAAAKALEVAMANKPKAGNNKCVRCLATGRLQFFGANADKCPDCEGTGFTRLTQEQQFAALEKERLVRQAARDHAKATEPPAKTGKRKLRLQ